MSARVRAIRALAALAVPAAVALMTWPASANPLDAFGFGTRSVGMAGATTAVVDDFSANYYNPGALAAGDALRLELGYIYVAPALELNDADLGVDESRGLQGGLVVPFEIFDRTIAASVGLFLPDRLVSRIRSLPQSQPRFALWDNRPQRVVISTSLAVEIIEGLYLGAGVTFLANTKGVVEIGGLVSFNDDEDTDLKSAVDVDLESVRYPSVGILYKPIEQLSLGLTWREEFTLILDLDVDVQGDIASTLLDDPVVLVEDGRFLLESFNTNLFSPRQVAFGVAWTEPDWTVSLDVTWVQWSRFPAPTATIDIGLELGNLPFEIPPIDDPLEPNFSDIVVPRIGGEVKVVDLQDFDLTLRAGYFYEPSPAPDQPGATNYVDTDKHGFAAGFGLAIGGLAPVLTRPLEIDVSGIGIWLPERAYTKTDANDPIGDYRADGHALGLSVTTKLLF